MVYIQTPYSQEPDLNFLIWYKIWAGKWHCYVMSILPNTVEFCWVYLDKQCLNDGDLFKNKRIRKQLYVAICLTTTNDCIVSIHTFYQTSYCVTMFLSFSNHVIIVYCTVFYKLCSSNCDFFYWEKPDALVLLFTQHFESQNYINDTNTRFVLLPL